MIATLGRLDGVLDRLGARISADLLALLARVSLATLFLRSGLLKVEGWADGTTIALFREEYALPLVSPAVAAAAAMGAELVLPPLLLAGLLTRPAALGLLAMTTTIQIFVYPAAFDTHGLWAVALLLLLRHGPGRFALGR